MRTLLASLALTAAFAFGRPALAVDNSTHVIGLGADTTFTTSEGILPQLSAKFALRPRLELSLQFGVSVTKAEAIFTPGLKIAYVLIPEKNMNLYIAGAIAVDLRTTNGLNAFLYSVGPGVELFLTELPNLGLALEFGLHGSVASNLAEAGPTEAQTNLVTAFGGAGVHYYF
jgi:hypothetical protein